MISVVTAGEVTKSGETVKRTERNELGREIMTCFSKRFSLTNDDSTMENDFTLQVGHLAEKEGAEDILRENIPQTLQWDNDAKDFFEM